MATSHLMTGKHIPHFGLYPLISTLSFGEIFSYFATSWNWYCLTFCSLQNRRISGPSAVHESAREARERTRNAKPESSACSHTIVYALPTVRLANGLCWLVTLHHVILECFFPRRNTITYSDSTDRFAVKLFAEFNWKYGPISIFQLKEITFEKKWESKSERR